MNRQNMSVSPSDRRGFLKQVSAAGLGLSLTPAILKGADDRKVSLGLIGIGGRGSKLLRLCLGFPDVSIPAVCDIAPDNLRRAQDAVEESGRSRPEGYGKDERSYLELLQRDDLDGVVIATPWELHIPMAVDSMKAGIYAGVEVGPANSIEECWELVETYEETRVPCMLLENHCYARYNMAILRMVRESVFGELIHCQCGYAHDLRERLVLGKGTGPTPKGEGDYRSTHNQYRNGELYPTHSIGPIAHCLNIQRGNRFEYLTSMATKSRGLGKWSEDNLPAGHPRRNIAWRQGDLVTTTIKCANEETVVVKFDTRLPRPNSFLYVVQGTKGIWMQDADSSSKDKSMIYLDGMEPPHRWQSFDRFQERYEHPLWKRYLAQGIRKGHGGTDFLELRAFKECIKRKINTPIDVYDMAAWMAISPLSEQSIRRSSAPVDFPEFTQGKWMSNPPWFGFTEAY